jgi:hypothetical protein
MLIHGQNNQSPFPWELPLWQPDYAIFFGVLYAVILILGIGLSLVFARSIMEARKSDKNDH